MCLPLSYNFTVPVVFFNQKNAANPIRLAALENRIHLLSNSLLVCCRDCCFFSGTNISQILSLVISNDLPMCLRFFATQNKDRKDDCEFGIHV